MATIDAIRKPILADLDAFDEFVKENITAEGDLMREMLTYALSSRGKGVRPMLTMLCASLMNTTDSTNNEEAGNERHCSKRTYLAAMLVEMIHTASLIHDDVLDSADERRGRASVNAKWQSNMAIILGDFILARTMALGMASAQYDIMSYIGTAMATLCEGEVLQSQHARNLDTSRDDYFAIIYQKTASLLGVSAALGALSVGASREDVDRMRKFGEAIGIAFQIQDDILDVWGNPETFGKAVGGDISCNKKTFVALTAMQLADSVTYKELKRWFAQTPIDNIEKITAVKTLYEQINTRAKCEEAVERYTTQALYLLNQLPQNQATEQLRKLADKLNTRQN